MYFELDVTLTHHTKSFAFLFLRLGMALKLDIARKAALASHALAQIVAENACLEMLADVEKSSPSTAYFAFLDRVICFGCPYGDSVELRTSRHDDSCHKFGGEVGGIARL